MRAVAVSLVLLASGCGGNSNVSYSSNTLPAGGVSSGGAVYAQSSSGSWAGTLFVIGFLGSVLWADDSQPQGWGIGRWASPRPAPSLDVSRTVNEQDCSKPIENWSANLKCR
jgi:hypothetical protein